MLPTFASSFPANTVAAPYDKSRPVAFLHIPKTSGRSISAGLHAALHPSIVVSGFDLCLFGDFQNFEVFDDAIRQHIYQTPDSLPKGADLVTGHMALSTLRSAYPRAQILTVLREPLSRLLSHWLYFRQHSDKDLAQWGSWADRVRCARKPFREFLGELSLAFQIDNLATRMLLWPHPKIPDNGLINPAHDKELTTEALARLRSLDFVDVVENEHLVENLERWIGSKFIRTRENGTDMMPEQFRTPLSNELTGEACDLLTARSRIDLCLWTEIASARLPHRDIPALRQQTTLANVARHSALMAVGIAS